MVASRDGSTDGGHQYPQNIFPIDPILDYYQGRIEKQSYYGDSWPNWWPNFGPGIMAGFLGANVHQDENTVWFETPSPPQLTDIRPEYDADNFWWSWVKEITNAAVDRWGSQVTVAHTDLGGNLDIIASLRGTQNLLTDLYDAPENVDRLVQEITLLWQHYYDELYAFIQRANNGTTAWTPLWCTGRYYMLQCDFAYMISPRMFERFVMPDLESCCHHLDYGFYHLDGKGQIRHLEMLLSIKNLRGIQWVPGDGQSPASEWLPLLQRIRDADKLCQIYAKPREALDVVRELGGKGFAFWIIDPHPQEEIAAFLDTLETLQ
jgi:5-methyltetrahydrofolate--homocysteine methyltransferase